MAEPQTLDELGALLHATVDEILAMEPDTLMKMMSSMNLSLPTRAVLKPLHEKKQALQPTHHRLGPRPPPPLTRTLHQCPYCGR
jgi:hypothetical protein